MQENYTKGGDALEALEASAQARRSLHDHLSFLKNAPTAFWSEAAQQCLADLEGFLSAKAIEPLQHLLLQRGCDVVRTVASVEGLTEYC